ncbi:hypothetical protein OG21DRAFT_1489483 [Imleria badia]|nr:hypothetical protein OG21DRAFT_1489483 [Imleria badia]
MSSMTERSLPIEIEVGSKIYAVTFIQNGEYLVGGGDKGVQVWRVKDGKEVATMEGDTTHCQCLAVSKDGKWIAAGMFWSITVEIKQFDASSGSLVSERPVPGKDGVACIAIPNYGQFIAHSAHRIVTFWDMSTHTHLGLIQFPQNIRSIALSPDDRFLAIGGEDGKIIIKSLSRITNSTPLTTSLLLPTFQEPDIQIDNAALDSSTHDQLADAKPPLTETMTNTGHQTHHALANRALVRARLQQSEQAIDDAENPIKIRPSVNGYIAKSVALINRGKRAEGCRAYDLAFRHCDPTDVDLILLIKAVIVFMAGDHREAISRLDDLIATVQFNSICYVAYMYLLLGGTQMGTSDYDGAIQSFERARAKTRSCVAPDLSAISLISGWKFDGVDITIQQHMCDAFYAAGRTQDASESLLKMVNTLDDAVYMSGPIIKWVSGEFMFNPFDYRAFEPLRIDCTHRYLSAPECDSEMISNSAQHREMLSLTPLLREWAKTTLAVSEWKDALVAAASFTLPRVAIYRVVCERLEAIDRVTDAIDCSLEMMSELGGQVYMSGTLTEWVSGQFMFYLDGDTALHATPLGNTPTLHAQPTPLLREWPTAKLTRDSWKDVLASAVNAIPRATIYRAICERLETIHRITDAVECFRQMTSELGREVNLDGEHQQWVLGGWARTAHTDILIKRSKAFLATGSSKQALDDANQAITLDPSSPWGYEMKHAASHKAGEYENAIVQSPDPDIQQHGDQYISPSSTRATIRKIVQQTICHLPRVLINTTTGRLHDRAEQASAFEALPIFNELISSMTTRIDYVWIKREIRQYFRYVMLSHKWEENEPLFQHVIHIAVHDLDQSPTHDKLQMFCKIVQDAGFNWAWSDTCCINKSDHFILQEALVAMFKWYQDSAMMFVFLRGVRSPSQRGALVKSIWNTRAWTLQEYVASKEIRFYTEDWTLYLDLELPNHKESPEVTSEMEHATGVSAQQLMALRPGLTSIREKLRLASTRQTTLVEDAAYSLLGIFSVTGIPAIYDVSILAWSGDFGSFNSCLPAHISVFNRPATSHLPSPLENADMAITVTTPPTSTSDLDAAWMLYERLNALPSPWFAASRMKPPCIAFELSPLSAYRTRSGRVYRAETVAFGMVEIKTRQDLSRMKSLYLIHPWLGTLLDREEMQSGPFIEDDVTPPHSPHTDDGEVSDEEIDDDSLSVPEFKSPSAPVSTVPMDKETRARRLAARLRQPFGALLLTLASTGRRVVDYRRVAAVGLITVQIQENVLLADLLDNVCTLDVL